MLAVRLDKEMEKRIEKIAKLTKRPKSYFVKRALEIYLDDLEDVEVSLMRLQNPEDEVIDEKDFWKRV
jgi:RHH-type rel operon transcriptional repressor/antitoxin RelB